MTAAESSSRRNRRLKYGALLIGAVAIGALLFFALDHSDDARMHTAPPYRLAVLGDSDSHSYRDTLRGVRRGGEYHDVTLQWTEILARIRPDWLDQGEFTERGSRRLIARIRDRLGLEAAAPAKRDFRWNYALSGARCSSLVSGSPQQARWLASAIRAEPAAWRDGIVVIRIGVNDLGQRRHIEQYAESGLTPEISGVLRACVREVAAAVDLVRDASPTVRIVVVGVADDSSWPPETTPRRDAEQIRRIREVLNAYDDGLRALVAQREAVAFMSDRPWYYDHWADRDAEGNARRSERSLGGPTTVTNTQGDAPHHLLLADGHAGTVANGFWARELIRVLNQEFRLGIPEPSDAELARLADPDGRFGIAP